MQTFTVEEAARRWLSAPKLDPETERAAAEATIAFLTDVRSKIEAHLEDIKAGRALADGSGLQEVWDFSHFDPKHIDFLLATLGEGEVRIKLFGGEAKAGDTSVPGLWRVQSGRSGQENFFVLARLPRTVQVVGTRGLDKIPQLVNPSADVFAAPAILQELQYRLDAFDADAGVPDMPTDPCFMLELKRQPLSPGDMTALLSTLGQGDIDVELQGITRSHIQNTKVRNLWRTRIINNAGKTLLDAYVIAKVPPEIPISAEEFADGAAKCTDLIEWVRHDLQRGTLGGGEIKAEEVLNV